MKVLADEKLIEKAFSSELIEKKIKENFTHIWLLFYSMQIDMVVRWTSYFGDMASFHVWGTCITNQAYNLSRAKKIKYPTSLKIVNQNLIFLITPKITLNTSNLRPYGARESNETRKQSGEKGS